MTNRISRPFTGYHMTAILFAFFGIVIAVNITMAKFAIGTFGGTVVENSYVASQSYNQWLAQADRQEQLGWAVAAARRDDGKMQLTVTGQHAEASGLAIRARAQHPLGRAPEQILHFEAQGDGSHVSRERLQGGRWMLHIEIRSGDDVFKTMVDIR